MTKTMALSEGQATILERLIEAMETDIALPVRVGPKSFGSSMPDYIHTAAENFVREREDLEHTGGARTREDRDAERRRTERRAKCSSVRISRMEAAFDWVRQYIFDDEARQVLLAYAEVKARGWDWSRYIAARNKRNPKKKAWVRRTLYRWIVRSLQIIEQKTAQTAPLWRTVDDLQMAHEAAKGAGKSITSGLHAWSEPDEHPALKRTA